MTITIHETTKESIELKEFCEYVDKKYKHIGIDEMIEIAPMFKKLFNNREFLKNYIVNELKQIHTFQIDNPYSSQSLNLYHSHGKFYIRANVWLPDESFHSFNGSGEKKLFAYYQPHDHNFNFMTIGYFGSGYKTKIYEYNHHTVKGYIGEKINIDFLEHTSLPEGKIMLYRASKDIHIQLCPDEFSVSLNLMTPAMTPLRDQYMFDIEKSIVSGIIRSSFSGRKLILDMASHFCDDNILDTLETIANNHHCERTRKTASNIFYKNR